jgi:hypothetical protein
MSLCAPAGEKTSPGCGSSHRANFTIVAAVAAYWCWMQSHIMLTAATSHNRRQVLCWTRPPRQGSLKDFSCLHSCGAWAPLVMQKHAQSLTSFSGVCVCSCGYPRFFKRPWCIYISACADRSRICVFMDTCTLFGGLEISKLVTHTGRSLLVPHPRDMRSF